jgi:hypothetical protein
MSSTREPTRLGTQQLEEPQVDVGRMPIDPAGDAVGTAQNSLPFGDRPDP